MKKETPREERDAQRQSSRRFVKKDDKKDKVAQLRAAELQRKLSIPAMVFDENLPVSARRNEIAEAIQKHQVIVLCGETGSGKSTQLPKICLELGFGVRKLIGHTQPRRIAAISIANRLARELAEGKQLPPAKENEDVALIPPEKLVGYKIRFSDHTSNETCVKLMTDGILLAETQGDRLLNRYEVLIIDEAHERSLNIDFLIGVARRLVDKRPDLKLIITSATIDAERFAAHFETPTRSVPIIQVEGRTYPVDVVYAPILDDEGDDEEYLDEESLWNSEKKRDRRRETRVIRDGDVHQATINAIEMLADEGRGDMLVFMPTERDIHELAKLLHGEAERRQKLPFSRESVEILPLYARLPAADQQKIFNPTSNKRRIVIATNVAESSVTVPGIRFVIDSGTARISRYSARSKTQRLPIEPVSRASADQRKGRCGRIGAGICVRLYSEEDYNHREAYTQPEIQRTNLASVILQTKMLRLGRIESFPFLDAPKMAAIRDGYKTLFELQALTTPTSEGELTPLGAKLARLPVDPRIGRMVLAAIDEAQKDSKTNPLLEVLIIASALEIRDPRERPIEKLGAADAAHEKFLDATSDFVSLLKLWSFYRDLEKKLSRNQLMKACRQNFISWNRMREWVDVYHQLRELVQEILREEKLPATLLSREEETKDAPRAESRVGALYDSSVENKHYAALHRALLSGLLSNLGHKNPSTPGEYSVGGGGKSYLWPGSGILKRTSNTNPLGINDPRLNAQKEEARQMLRRAKAGRRFWGRNLDAHGNPTSGDSTPADDISFVLPQKDETPKEKKSAPDWVMAAEMVETSKRFLRALAIIEPLWAEELAQHLVTRTYSEPHWSKQYNCAMVYEKVSLFGLVLVPKRRVPYAKVDPTKAREMFIQAGLVEGNWTSNADFYQHNRNLWHDLEQIQAKLRRYDYLPGVWKMYEFYDARIPLEVVDNTTMEKWLRALESGQALDANDETGLKTLEALKMHESDLVDETPDDAFKAQFPNTFSGEFFLPAKPLKKETQAQKRSEKPHVERDEARDERLPQREMKLFGQKIEPLQKPKKKRPTQTPTDAAPLVESDSTHESTLKGVSTSRTLTPPISPPISTGYAFPLEYRFEPGSEQDGVTICATLETIHQLNPRQLEWGIPGLLEERVACLIKSLPRDLRRKLIPAPDTARRVCATLDFGVGNFYTILAAELTRLAGEFIRETDFDVEKIPLALQMNVRVSDSKGNLIVESRDYTEVLRCVGTKAAEKFASIDDTSWNRGGFTSWAFGELPIHTEIEATSVDAFSRAGKISAFPTLHDEGSSVGVRLAASQTQAESGIRQGVTRLFRLGVAKELLQQAEWLPGYHEMRAQAAAFTQSTGRPLSEALGDLLAHLALDPAGLPGLDDMKSLLDSVPRNEKEFARIFKQGKDRIRIIVQEIGDPMRLFWKSYASATRAINSLCTSAGENAAAKLAQGLHFGLSRNAMEVSRVQKRASEENTQATPRRAKNERLQPVVDDLDRQISRLMPPHFLLTTPWGRLRHFSRYLQGIEIRVQNILTSNNGLQSALTRGTTHIAELNDFWREYEALRQDFLLRGVESEELDEFRWLLEEYRISLFAQKLGTSVPVSSKRLEKMLSNLK
ncbi:MAG: ATP-dependent RNA helicase HrpA [Planctomycetia bacterium]|nr:ATP-dependent RNA helicase HrpA [Planctomycetia bacterium]